jgi:shikimate dehydrogenase
MTAHLEINGATRLYGIVGDPIVQVRSPEVYSAQFAAAGMNAVLVPFHATSEQFDAVMPSMMKLANLDGLLVTAPFKARALALPSRLGPTARCIGALNALRREADGSWVGDMFDGEGFVRGLLDKGEQLEGRRVLMFGAGGAASAIACALAAAGVASIRIVNPDPEQAAQVAHALGAAFPACDIAPATASRDGFNMVVNASPVGMKPGDGLPGDIGPLTPQTLVGDVVISKEPTALVRQAIASGCRWANGHDMHSGQIAAIMGFFAPDNRTQPAARR